MLQFAEAFVATGMNQQFEYAWQIYEDGFPPDERRSLQQQKEVLLNPRYKFTPALGAGNAIVGVICTWQFDEFLFVEHIAVASNARGGGTGTKMMASLCQGVSCPIILETDPPSLNATALRRVKWYEQLGFHMNEFEYLQPAYSSEKQPLPMKLFSFPKPLSPAEFERIRAVLYSEVYKVVGA